MKQIDHPRVIMSQSRENATTYILNFWHREAITGSDCRCHDTSSSSSSSFCDLYKDFEYLQEYFDDDCIDERKYLVDFNDMVVFGQKPKEKLEDEKFEEKNKERASDADDTIDIVFMGPPVKLNALGHYYCWSTYRSNVCTSPFRMIMLIKFDPYNEWAAYKLEGKIDLKSKIFWKRTSNYLVVDDKVESKIYFYNPNATCYIHFKKRSYHYEINLNNKSDYFSIKKCTDSEIYSLFANFDQRLFFIDLPEDEQIFKDQTTPSFSKCCKDIWDFRYNSTEHLLTKRDIHFYEHMFKDRIEMLHRTCAFCIIQDKK